MAQVIWTTEATFELAAATRYLKSVSPQYADKLARKIYARAGQLANFPEMGRIVPEIDKPNHRELLEGNYRIMYELLDAIVLIQRVIHQNRNFLP